ncbi:MAG: aminodeoxychorismate synthase component I [Ignavibacteriaceae bacterium]|nr:aminodeoxychorismate synthase component I [Ignavibacteriaceae bacterium]
MEINKTIALMNEYGKERIPFLFIIDFEIKSPIIFKLTDVLSNMLFKVGDYKNYSDNSVSKFNLLLEKFPIDYEKYLPAFNKVMENINNGNTYLLNLTFPTKIKLNYTLKEIFHVSNAKYKLLFENKFVVFSPETFVQIKDNRIYSFPMKGTIDAAIEDAEEKLLNDKKELAEHNTIVDLIRNDLSMVSQNVRVEKFRYIDKIKTSNKTLLQTSSKICGELKSNYHQSMGDILFKLLPAGSISGAPKRKTVEIIKDAEEYSRGYFTGIFGIFNGKELDSAVMIRFIENINGDFYFKSGGGITFMSNPELEYQEMIDKIYVPII